jgi:hypothetical protein
MKLPLTPSTKTMELKPLINYIQSNAQSLRSLFGLFHDLIILTGSSSKRIRQEEKECEQGWRKCLDVFAL